MIITPVLLAGGSGTRLWPLSRKSYPKQFSSLMGDETLFQSSAKRMTSSGALHFAAPVVLTNSDFRFIVTEQLAGVGIDPGAILIEPEGRNTAPAVLAAAFHIAQTDPDGILLIAPSDHVIPDTDQFHRAVLAGRTAVEAGQLVTFGITPDRAETGYGYLELSACPDGNGAVPLVSFVEKPDATRAQTLVEAGNYLWNAGIFLVSVKGIIDAFRTHAPDLYAPVSDAMTKAKPDLGFLRLDPEAWGQVEGISIDYAVMEKSDNLSVVPYGGTWSDLGGWDAVWRETAGDNGVALSGAATAIECKDSLLRSESPTQEIVGIGLDNIVAVAMPDAVLVADMNRGQEVKLAVTALAAKQSPQAKVFPKEHRPWGWFETLITGDRFKVKRIVVQPGASLSSQSHVHRAEHWVVVEGTARVTIGDDTQMITENQSVYIPLGAVHRLENPGRLPMVLVEVQTGAYVGEDDIIRYDDVYERQ